jgi:hypothetical protein
MLGMCMSICTLTCIVSDRQSQHIGQQHCDAHPPVRLPIQHSLILTICSAKPAALRPKALQAQVSPSGEQHVDMIVSL